MKNKKKLLRSGWNDVASGLLIGAVLGAVAGWGLDHFNQYLKTSLDNQLFITHLGPIFEGISRFLAGSGDNLAAILVVFYRWRKRKIKPQEGVVSYLGGALLGMLIAPFIQLGLNLTGSVTQLDSGWRIVYIIPFSTADNQIGNLVLLISAIKKYGLKQGCLKVFKIPFFWGNILALGLMISAELIVRLGIGFFTVNNLGHALENAILDFDSVFALGFHQIWLAVVTLSVIQTYAFVGSGQEITFKINKLKENKKLKLINSTKCIIPLDKSCFSFQARYVFIISGWLKQKWKIPDI